MADAGVMRAGDRLPWLEPYRAPPKENTARRSFHLIAAAAVALAGGSSWLMVRQAEAPADPAINPQSTVALPAPVDLQPQVAPPPLTTTAPPIVKVVTVRVPAAQPRRRGPARKIVNAGPERAAYETIMSEQIGAATLAPPPPAPAPVIEPAPPPPRPVVNPSAQVVRGKTAQLGVYLTARQAEAAWQSAIRDYTFLVTMPKSIEPVRIRSKRFYRLQLGTPSRRHARELCSNLRSTGRACTVA
jgi:hypothetical protein